MVEVVVKERDEVGKTSLKVRDWMTSELLVILQRITAFWVQL
ncbi:unnamed protein product [Strongylus vulgaris]|uniref:Uncharacterized protein n=1 Tax=Strongylus vulgaris TaxID=40348 RepID=A0A3P7IRV6_STRVU|nr:unnamed protein product [Strongylus vulgaris]